MTYKSLKKNTPVKIYKQYRYTTLQAKECINLVLKALDTIGNCQELVFPLDVSQQTHKKAVATYSYMAETGLPLLQSIRM